VTNNAIRDLVQQWNRSGRGSGDSQVIESMAAIQAPEALAALAAEIEAEAEWELLREAQERVKLRVKPHTWHAYYGVAIDSRPAAEVAQSLGMPVAEVYVAKSRVLKLLRQEIEKLDRFAL
jgi:RNA polymerase sigma-70 factor (ECF subfamily)